MSSVPDLHSYLNSLLLHVLKTGELLLSYAEQDISSTKKSDGTLVTQADKDAEILLTNALREISPFPIIGEEAFAANRADNIIGSEYFWLVDALDGTRAFVGGLDEYTINVALIRNGIPVFGIVYAPAYRKCYYAISGHGAFRIEDFGDRSLDVKLSVLPHEGDILNVIAGMRDDLETGVQRYLLQTPYTPGEIIGCHSSYKFCLLAEGGADLYPRFGPICEWDTAAGHVVLREAGGQVISVRTGDEITYGDFAGSFRQESFFAGRKNIDTKKQLEL